MTRSIHPFAALLLVLLCGRTGDARAEQPCAVTEVPGARSLLTPDGGIAIDRPPVRVREDSACPGPLVLRSAPAAERIVGSGPREARLDLLVLGDGYTEADASAFQADTDALIAALLATEPFQTHGSALDVWRSQPVSVDSGVSKDTRFETVERDTALSCTYGCGGADRIVCCDDAAVLEAAEAALPDADALFVLVNDDDYGGAGSPVYSVSFTGPDFEPVGVHELGHVLGDLYDEYTYGFDAGGFGPNCAVSPAFLPWDPWIGESGVSWFEGCTYDSLFRPTEEGCLMRELEGDFCPVCAEALTRTLLADAPVLVDVPADPAPGSTVSVGVSSEDLAETQVIWTVDGEPFAEGPTATLPACGTVEIRASWTSAFVRSDPDQLLTDTHRIALEPCSSGCDVLGGLHSWPATGSLVGLCLLANRRRRR